MSEFKKLPSLNLELSPEEVFEKLQNMILSHPNYNKKYNNFLKSSFTTIYTNLMINVMQNFNDKLETIVNNLFPSTVTDENFAYQILNLIGYNIQGTKAAQANLTLQFENLPTLTDYIEFDNFMNFSATNINNETSNFELLKQTDDGFDYLASKIIYNVHSNEKIPVFSGITSNFYYKAKGLEAEECEFSVGENIQLDSVKVYKKIDEETYIEMKKVDNFISENYQSEAYADPQIIPYIVYKKSPKICSIVFGISAYTENKIPLLDEEFVVYYRTSNGAIDNVYANAINTKKEFIISSGSETERISIEFFNEEPAFNGKDSENALDSIMSLVQKQKTQNITKNYKKKQEEDYQIILKDLSTVQNSISVGLKQFSTGVVPGEEKKLSSNDVFTYILKKASYENLKSVQEVDETLRLNLYQNFYTNYKLEFEQLKLEGTEDENYYAELPGKQIRYYINEGNIYFDFFITTKEIFRFENNFSNVKDFNYSVLPDAFLLSENFIYKKYQDKFYFVLDKNNFDNEKQYYGHFVLKEDYYFNYNQLTSLELKNENQANEHICFTIPYVVKQEKVLSDPVKFCIKLTENFSTIENFYDIEDTLFDVLSDSIEIQIENQTTLIKIKPDAENYADIKSNLSNNFFAHYLICRESDEYNSIISIKNDEQEYIDYLNNFSMLKIDDYIKEPIVVYFTLVINLYVTSNVAFSNEEIKKQVRDNLKNYYSLYRRNFGEAVYLSDVSKIIKESNDYIEYFSVSYFGLSNKLKDTNVIFNNQIEKISMPFNTIIIPGFDKYGEFGQEEGIVITVFNTQQY